MSEINTSKWLKNMSAEQRSAVIAARALAKLARGRRANKLYAQRHPERVAKRARAYRTKNADYIRGRNRKWRLANQETVQESMDRWRTVPRNRMKSIISSRMADAKRRGIPVDELAMREFIASPPVLCAISGLPLDYSVGRGKKIGMSPSVDRIKPELGYVRGNIAIIGHRFNTIKSFGTAAEHHLVAEYLERIDAHG